MRSEAIQPIASNIVTSAYTVGSKVTMVSPSQLLFHECSAFNHTETTVGNSTKTMKCIVYACTHTCCIYIIIVIKP